MTEQEIEAAAERVRLVKDSYEGGSVYGLMPPPWESRYQEDCELLSNAHPLVSPPPTLTAADSEGYWWHIYEAYGDRQYRPEYVWPIDGRWYYRSAGGRLTEATGGLWQRAIGPFGMEGEK